MPTGLTKLMWESDFFGRDIFQFHPTGLSITHAVKWLNSVHGLVQSKIASTQIAQYTLLQQLGFQFIEREVTFLWSLSPQVFTFPCTPATPADLTALYPLVENAFLHSRFRPPYYSHAECQRFYRHWIYNAVYGKFDHLCLVARQANDLTGVISLRMISTTKAKIGLLAVSPNHQRQGIATTLLNQASQWALSNGAQELIISTQGENHPAITCYQALGAKKIAENSWWYLSR